jgi:hypothetical protein
MFSKKCVQIIKIEKLLDVASECPDSLDFSRNKKFRLWTPNEQLLMTLNSNLLNKLKTDRLTNSSSFYYVTRMAPRVPAKKKPKPLAPIFQKSIIKGDY